MDSNSIAYENIKQGKNSSIVSIPSHKSIQNLTLIYLLATLFVLIPACIAPEGTIASIGFFVGCLFILLTIQDINALTFYFLILQINTSLGGMTIVGTDYSINVLMYAFYVVMFFANLRFVSVLKRLLVPLLLIIPWVLYRAINAGIFGTGVIAVLWNGTPLLASVLIQVLVLRKQKYANHLVIAIFVAELIVCGTGFVELLIQHTFFYSLWKGTMYRYGIMRVGSTLADPNFLCLVDIALLFILNTSLFEQFFGKRTIRIVSALVILQVLLTVSRAGIVALVVCGIIRYICTKKGRILLLIPVLFIAAAAIPTLWTLLMNIDTGSSGTRLRIIFTAFEYWKGSPLIGFGAGAFTDATYSLMGSDVDTMNVFIDILTSYGVVGMFFYIMYVIRILRIPVRNMLKNNITSLKSGASIIAAMCSWLIMSFSLDTFSIMVFWSMPALVLVLLNYEQLGRRTDVV